MRLKTELTPKIFPCQLLYQKLFRQLIKNSSFHFVAETIFKIILYVFFFVDFFPKFFFRLKYADRQAIVKHMKNYSFYKSSFSRLNDGIKLSRADSSQNSEEAAERFKYFFFVDIFPKVFFRLMYAARHAIAKHMENYSFYKSSFSPLNDGIKLSRADSSQNSEEAAERFKYFFFVDIFPKVFFRLMYAARHAIAKHMENYSFYKSSFSPLNDEIKFSRTDSSQNSGEAAEGFKSNNK